ncbi:MAG: hypothetical protein MZW92_21585 [Comamonadaceae bacterium]|nr:hypothetical protein [Comamonadaceae bacterium]
MLVLDKADGRARLRVAQPRRRPARQHGQAVAARARRGCWTTARSPPIPLHLIGPFLNEAVVFDGNELDDRAAHRRHAGRPRDAVARRDRLRARRPRRRARLPPVPRAAPLRRPRRPSEVLGYEARYVGTAEYVRAGEDGVGRRRQAREIVPATFGITSDAARGRRRRPPVAGAAARTSRPTRRTRRRRRSTAASSRSTATRLSAGQNQIVALNRGTRDGIERGHVLALWRAGRAGGRHAPTPSAGGDAACPTSATACCSSSASSSACPTR